MTKEQFLRIAKQYLHSQPSSEVDSFISFIEDKF